MNEPAKESLAKVFPEAFPSPRYYGEVPEWILRELNFRRDYERIRKAVMEHAFNREPFTEEQLRKP